MAPALACLAASCPGVVRAQSCASHERRPGPASLATPRRGGRRRCLRPYGFRDPAQADRELQALAEDPQARQLLAAIVDDLLMAASDSADPDGALTRFERFVRAAGSPGRVFSHLGSDPRMIDVLLRTFGASPFLAEILIRQPGWMYWLSEPERPRPRRDGGTRSEADLASALGSLRSEERRRDALRVAKRREILHIGVRDLLRLASVDRDPRGALGPGRGAHRGRPRGGRERRARGARSPGRGSSAGRLRRPGHGEARGRRAELQLRRGPRLRLRHRPRAAWGRAARGALARRVLPRSRASPHGRPGGSHRGRVRLPRRSSPAARGRGGQRRAAPRRLRPLLPHPRGHLGAPRPAQGVARGRRPGPRSTLLAADAGLRLRATLCRRGDARGPRV